MTANYSVFQIADAKGTLQDPRRLSDHDNMKAASKAAMLEAAKAAVEKSGAEFNVVNNVNDRELFCTM